MTTKILVADDSATMRRVLEMTFAGEDASVVTVAGSEEAVAKAREVGPDVIFADASMEGVDGYELAKRIKSDPALSKTAVILMASQHAPFDEGRGRESGVDDHISKPFDTQAVIDRVGQVVTRTRASGPAAAEPAAAAAPPAAPMPAPAVAPARPPAPATSAAGPQANRAPASMPRPFSSAQGTMGGIGTAPAAMPRPAPAVAPKQASVPTPAAAAVAATSGASPMAQKLSGLGLSAQQVEGVLALSREVIEQVVWEVVPDLAEVLIKEEIKRLTSE